ncbi:MAG: caspase family protein [Rhodobacterales bacterium]|nr:caspase family protein [Rhodobacterales bacterium]
MTLALTLASPVVAEVRAVVVGVGDYKVLDADLKGPPNDARLMAEVLIARGIPVADITVLSTDPTGLPPGIAVGPADRSAIIVALDSAGQSSVPGDTVVFYFSGHGAQAPDTSGDEGGGYDEILLPADAAGWKGATQSVENAILDDELQTWAQGLLYRGIKVVGLIDACHSATGFRAIGGEGVARVVDEAALGIPQDVVPVAGSPQPPLSGEFVFLYSSQSDQRSFEYPLADGVTWQGEFTLRLAQTLRDTTGASWSQVLAATREAMVQGPARQMPDGEGPLLDAAVFGEGSGITRWPVAAGMVEGGLLQGLAKGAEVALFANPAQGEPLAVLTLAEVSARTSTLDGALPATAAWAELVSTPPPAPLTLAAPVRADPGDGLDYAAWIAALPPSGDHPDLVPILTGGAVALAGADGVLDPEGPGSSPRIVAEAGESPAQAVARMLEQAAHGLRLREALAGATGRSLTGGAPITMSIDRRMATGGCDAAASPVPYDPALGVAACDQLWLTLTNTGGKSQDVSVLYFTASFAVQPIWPTQNLVNRLAPGESVRVGLQIEEGSTAGLEEIWVLAVPVDPAAPRVDLTRLATPQLTRAVDRGSDAMTLWLEGRLTDNLTDEATDDETAMRGFTLKPAPLAMLRQMVLLKPGPD